MKRSAVVLRVVGITLVLLLAIHTAWSRNKTAGTKKAGVPMKNPPPQLAGTGVPVEGLNSFSSMGKGLRVLAGGREAELFRHQGRGCITHMWFGGDWPGYGKTRIRFYIDGEAKPSIDMELFLGHGIGFGDPAAPWGNQRLGKTGHPSGLYNTYKIPFGKSVRITAQNEGVQGDPEFWWIFRGVENLPLHLGNLRLPDNARLRLYKLDNVTVKPFEMVDLCRSPRAGALYQVTLAARGTNLTYLEAVLRAYKNGAKEPEVVSSGTEDYFLGTYYFNRGTYHTALGGCTHLDTKDSTFSGYRFHEEDPILFKKGLRFVWRNGERAFWTKEDAPLANPGDTVISSYAWVYEW